MTPKEIGKQLGCSGNTVREHLKKMNIAPTRHRQLLTDEQEKQIEELAEQAFSQREIGRRVGCCHATVRKYLKSIQ